MVTSGTTKTIARAVTPESGLVLQDILTLPTCVERVGLDNGNKNNKTIICILVQ